MIRSHIPGARTERQQFRPSLTDPEGTVRLHQTAGRATTLDDDPAATASSFGCLATNTDRLQRPVNQVTDPRNRILDPPNQRLDLVDDPTDRLRRRLECFPDDAAEGL